MYNLCVHLKGIINQDPKLYILNKIDGQAMNVTTESPFICIIFCHFDSINFTLIMVHYYL